MTDGLGAAVYLLIMALINIGIILFLIITSPSLIEAFAMISWCVLSSLVGLVWWSFSDHAV